MQPTEPTPDPPARAADTPPSELLRFLLHLMPYIGLGPLIGFFVFLGINMGPVKLATGLSSPQSMTLIPLIAAYLLAWPAALVTGGIGYLLEQAMSRRWLSMVAITAIGAVSAVINFDFLGRTMFSFLQMSQRDVVSFAAAGATAALACGLIGQLWKLAWQPTVNVK